MNRLIDVKGFVVVLGLLLALFSAASASAAPPYEFDPYLSLTGDCSTNPSIDPVPDPSCVGEPPAYPPPPDRPLDRFEEPRAIAVDSFGNEYVASWADSSDTAGRIDIFDDEGEFISEAAVPNAKSIAVDSKGNLYVYEDNGKLVRYPPSLYEGEAGNIEYKNSAVPIATGGFFGAVAVDASNDRVFVAGAGSITVYRSAQESEPNTVAESFSPAGLGTWTEAIAVDSQRRRVYTTYCKADGAGKECGVKVVGADPPHTVLKNLEGPSETENFAAPNGRLGLAVDEETGDFFVVDSISAKTAYAFNESYEYLSRIESNEFQANISTQIAVSNGERSLSAEPCGYPKPEDAPPAGQACNRHYLFIPIFKAKGRAFAYHPPGQTPPVIESVSPAGIGETEAELRARIFPGGVKTTYHFEITTQAKYEASEWTGATSLGEGTIAAESLATEVSGLVTNLVPGETYRFRAVASNDLGPAEEEGQNEAIFATYDDAPISKDCANQAQRLELAAKLPDCRGYELVTPSDTNGRPPRGLGLTGSGGTFPTVHSSLTGKAVSFKIEGGSLPGTVPGVGGFEGDPYTATRTASGWDTALAGPTGAEAVETIPGSVSRDQGYLYWQARVEGPLLVNGEPTSYIRHPDGHSELVGEGSIGIDPSARGKLIVEDGAHVIFQTIGLGSGPIQLEPNAPPTGTRAVYDRTTDPESGTEVVHVVSLLPGDITPGPLEDADYVGASQDGSGIAFKIDNTLYLRLDNETTFEVGTGVEFAGISEGGGRIFYVQGGNLKALDTGSEEVIDFSSTGNVTPVNVANDGSRAYFVSPSVLGGTNPEGDEAQAGEQNLYLSEEGAISFIATVTDRDVEGEDSNGIQIDGLGLWTDASNQPARDPSRLNPDGSVLLFQSRANITGYEASEFPQIYRYDSTAERLHCISCIPTKTPATGGASLEDYTLDSFAPPPLNPNGFVANLTPNGNRVFFESTEPLVSTDTDEVRDVYEWEEIGVGSCARAGGCVYLISSGQSSRENFLYAHSESGEDVFFSTEDALTGFDSKGTASIYDAKVGGGFPGPPKPKPCVADGCRPTLTPPPSFPTSVAGGGGNVPKPKTCPKNKRKVKKNGKVQCVKKKQKKHKGGKAKRAGVDRRAGK